MIVFSLKIAGQDHLIAWNNKEKKPEEGSVLMPPAEFAPWAEKAFPKVNWPPILDLVKRKGTSFPNPEKDLGFCLKNYTYIKRHGRQGGTLTREEFVELYGPKKEANKDVNLAASKKPEEGNLKAGKKPAKDGTK